MEILTIAGVDDVGTRFEFKGEYFEIIQFRPRATKNPFIVKNLSTNEKFLLPLTDNILIQIRKGKVIDFS